MSITSLDDYSSTDRAHLAQLRKTKRDRLHVLELQEARHGSHTEAGVLLEIRDLRAALAALDVRLAELAAQPPATTPVPAAIAPVLPAVVVPPAAPPAFANPFTPGVVVPPDRFIGRAYELRTILARLENLLSVSIVRVCPPGQPLPRHPPQATKSAVTPIKTSIIAGKNEASSFTPACTSSFVITIFPINNLYACAHTNILHACARICQNQKPFVIHYAREALTL